MLFRAGHRKVLPTLNSDMLFCKNYYLVKKTMSDFFKEKKRTDFIRKKSHRTKRTRRPWCWEKNLLRSSPLSPVSAWTASWPFYFTTSSFFFSFSVSSFFSSLRFISVVKLSSPRPYSPLPQKNFQILTTSERKPFFKMQPCHYVLTNQVRLIFIERKRKLLGLLEFTAENKSSPISICVRFSSFEMFHSTAEDWLATLQLPTKLGRYTTFNSLVITELSVDT